jgi:acyl CoA:acetate/3-ketoacid CoA transferase beta subunit
MGLLCRLSKTQVDEWYTNRMSVRVAEPREEGPMVHLDLNAACNVACSGLPEGWVIEIHLEKGVTLLGLFPPNGARQDFDVTEATMAEQALKAIAVAKAASPESKSRSANVDDPIQKATS